MLRMFMRGRHRGFGRRGPFGPFGGALGADWQEAWGAFGGWGRGPGGAGPRVERGDVKLLILGVLRDGPKHGYEIMRAIEERTQGRYTPSPGTVYPTLQMLEDLGHVHATQTDERKVYAITDTGRGWLEGQEQAERDAWGRSQGEGGRGPFGNLGSEDQRALREELVGLGRALFAGGRIFQADPATLKRVATALKTARQQVEAAFAEYV